jgi:hypothetical protein
MIIPPFKGFIIVSFTYQDELSELEEVLGCSMFEMVANICNPKHEIKKETTSHFKEKISLN